MRRRSFLFLALSLLAPLPRDVRGQDAGSAARVDPATGALEVDVARFLSDDGLRRALHSGLPVRMEVRVELWKDGFFDQQAGGGTWRASVVYDPVTLSYEVLVGEGPPEAFRDLAESGAALAAAFSLDVRPVSPGRYYFLAEVEMQTLSLSDLEELGRWLQGDLGPVVSGDRPPETAVAKGLRRLMVRALGLPARRERLRTRTFDWPPGSGGTGT